jgi:hypothetical protein
MRPTLTVVTLSLIAIMAGCVATPHPPQCHGSLTPINAALEVTGR